MFYRFISRLATQERLRAFPVSLSGDHLKYQLPYEVHCEDLAKPIRERKSPKGLTLRHTPSVDWPLDMALRFDPGRETRELPDIWCVEQRLLVSDRAATVIAAHDDLDHAFTPFEWLDADNRPFDVGQPWYWLNVRRFVDIEPSPRVATPTELGFCALRGHEDFLARVIDEPALRAHLEAYPIWHRLGTDSYTAEFGHRRTPFRRVFYLGPALFEALRKAGVSGLDVQSEPFGDGESPVNPV